MKTKHDYLDELQKIDSASVIACESRGGVDHPALGLLRPAQKISVPARLIDFDIFVPVKSEAWDVALKNAISSAKNAQAKAVASSTPVKKSRFGSKK